MRDLMKDHLNKFGMSLSDIGKFVTDMGSDVQNVARICGKFSFPCLCHFIYLIAKALKNKLQSDEENDADDDDLDDRFDQEDKLCDLISTVVTAVKRIKDSPVQEDNLTNLRKTVSGKSVMLIRNNHTCGNFLLDTIERLWQLRTYITMLDIDLFLIDWDQLSRIIAVPKPLKECTLELQKNNASSSTAGNVINFLRHFSTKEQAIAEPTRKVLRKWINGNDVIQGIFQNSAAFYVYKRRKCVEDTNPANISDDDHNYNPQVGTSFHDFLKRSRTDNEAN